MKGSTVVYLTDSSNSNKRPPVKIVVELKAAPVAQAAPAKIKDGAPSPYARYSKGAYRVVSDGDQYRVDDWGDVTETWTTKLRYPKATYRLEETPVEYRVFISSSDAQDRREQDPNDPVMDAVARQNKHMDANPRLRERLEQQAATQRAFDEQRARNHPKATR